MQRMVSRTLEFLASTRFRLAAGLAIIVAVLGSALLFQLNAIDNLSKLTHQAGQSEPLRLWAREAVRLARVAVDEQAGYLDAEFPAEAQRQRVDTSFRRVRERMHVVRVSPVDRRLEERLVLFDSRTRDLADRFRSRIVPLKKSVAAGQAARQELVAEHEASVQLMDELEGFPDALQTLMDMTISIAEGEAAAAAETGIILSRAVLTAALLLSLVVVVMTHRAISRPIEELTRGTEALATGDLGVRISEPARGEFQSLARAFNRMTEDLQAHQTRLVEAQKLATVGRLAAAVAHEINNPIAVILGYVRMILRRMPEDAPHRQAIVTIEEEARQCESIVGELLAYSRPVVKDEPEVVHPRELVEDALNHASVLAADGDIEFEADMDVRPVFLGLSAHRFRQIVTNLVTNAIDALLERGGPGRIRVTGALETNGDRTDFVMEVRDNGPGIADDDIESVFEPFFTTKPKGTGLGLAITRNLLDAHGGEITVRRVPGGGAAFRVHLPVSKEQDVAP